jgi:hypothetical protein
MIHVDGQPAGFSVHEPISKHYALSHFHKTLSHFRNIDVFLTNYAAQDLLARGYKYVNWEQDLGVPGLKKSKQSYRPLKMLKKYSVAAKQTV